MSSYTNTGIFGNDFLGGKSKKQKKAEAASKAKQGAINAKYKEDQQALVNAQKSGKSSGINKNIDAAKRAVARAVVKSQSDIVKQIQAIQAQQPLPTSGQSSPGSDSQYGPGQQPSGGGSGTPGGGSGTSEGGADTPPKGKIPWLLIAGLGFMALKFFVLDKKPQKDGE